MFDDYTVLDFETSGLSAHSDYALEVGLIRVRAKKCIAQQSFFIKPHAKFEISSYTRDLTGITQADIDSGFTPEAAFEVIIDFIGQDCVVCHNTAFDMGFLMALARRSNTPIRIPTLCTLSIARKAYPLLHSHKLAYLAKEFGLSPPQHRALADCQATHELLQEVSSKIERKPSRKFYDQTFAPKPRQNPQADDQNMPESAAPPMATTVTPHSRGRNFLWIVPLASVAFAALYTKGSLSIGNAIAILVVSFIIVRLISLADG